MKAIVKGTTEWRKKEGHVNDVYFVINVEVEKEIPDDTGVEFKAVEKIISETAKALEKVSKE